jgi:nucleotide-binding universal stress UspA family protein
MEEHMYRHILIPTDGSELSHRAVLHGLALAKSVGAKVTGMTVEPTFNVYDVPASRIHHMTEAFEEYGKHAKEHAARILGSFADAAKAADVPCETVQAIHDHPYDAIVAVANENGCDLIVMASHGRSGLAAVVLGSVTTKVLTHTNIPVLVCR